jgi:hydroxyethylthiazole kinase-like sugar kinase family protein
MQVMEVATAVGPQAAGVVAAAPSLTVDASPATASAKATAAAAAAAAASAQKKVQKYYTTRNFRPTKITTRNLWTHQKYKRPHQKY